MTITISLSYNIRSFRTTLCLQYPPDKIGIGAIFLGTLFLSLEPLPARGPQQTWLELLGADLEEDELKGKRDFLYISYRFILMVIYLHICVIDICEQMLEAYEEASANTSDSSRVLDPKRVAAARSRLHGMAQPSLLQLASGDETDALLLQTSPNTITYPPSVSYGGYNDSSSENYEAVSVDVAEKKALPDTFPRQPTPPTLPQPAKRPLINIVHSAPLLPIQMPLKVSEENVDEVNLDDAYPYDDSELPPPPLEQSDPSPPPPALASLKRKQSDDAIDEGAVKASRYSASEASATVISTTITPP